MMDVSDRTTQDHATILTTIIFSKFQLNILLIKLILITVFPWLLSIYQIIDNPQNVFHVNNFTLKKGRKVLNIFLKRDPDTDRAENLIKWNCYFGINWGLSFQSDIINMMTTGVLSVYRLTRRIHFSELVKIILTSSIFLN